MQEEWPFPPPVVYAFLRKLGYENHPRYVNGRTHKNGVLIICTLVSLLISVHDKPHAELREPGTWRKQVLQITAAARHAAPKRLRLLHKRRH